MWYPTQIKRVVSKYEICQGQGQGAVIIHAPRARARTTAPSLPLGPHLSVTLGSRLFVALQVYDRHPSGNGSYIVIWPL